MAKPWEQYQQPAETSQAAGPWDQYKPAAAPQPISGGIPTGRQGYTLAEVPGAALQNIPKSAAEFGSNFLQMVTSPVQTVSGLINIGAGVGRKMMPQPLLNLFESMGLPPEAGEKATAAANAVGGIYKDRYGDYESIKRTFAEDPVGAAADLSTLLSGGGTAAVKVGATGTGKLLSTAGAYTNPTRVLAPIVEAPFKLAGKGIEAGFNALNPKAAAYLTAVEGRGPEIVNALRAPQELVPGSMPTAAQAASGVGATKFSALGADAAKTLPTPYFARGEAQKAAQLGQVQSVGGTPAMLTSAENIRKNTAKNLYGIADQALVSTDKTFSSLLAKPSMNKVLARAKELASEKGTPFQIGEIAPEIVTPSRILNAEGKPISSTITPATEAKLPGSSLHDMKMSFDDLINNPERFGIGASEVNAIKSTRAQFLNWAEAKAPDYRVARETFAEQSKPINKMEVGQYLEGKLTPALGEETAALRATGFAGAMENAPATLKKSTGQTRFQKLTEIFDPEDMAKLEAVRADLARAKLTEQQAKAAKGGGVDLGKVSSEALGGLRAPSLISTVTTVANDLMRRLQGKLDSKMAIQIATEMLDPSASAKAIDLALKRQAKASKAAAPIVGAGKTASKIIRTPAVTNALAPTIQNQNELANQ